MQEFCDDTAVLKRGGETQEAGQRLYRLDPEEPHHCEHQTRSQPLIKATRRVRVGCTFCIRWHLNICAELAGWRAVLHRGQQRRDWQLEEHR